MPISRPEKARTMDYAAVGRRRQWLLGWFAAVLLVAAPGPAFAMHIAEGIITGWPHLLQGPVASGAKSPGINMVFSHQPHLTIFRGLSLISLNGIYRHTKQNAICTDIYFDKIF